MSLTCTNYNKIQKMPSKVEIKHFRGGIYTRWFNVVYLALLKTNLFQNSWQPTVYRFVPNKPTNRPRCFQKTSGFISNSNSQFKNTLQEKKSFITGTTKTLLIKQWEINIESQYKQCRVQSYQNMKKYKRKPIRANISTFMNKVY